VLIDFVWHMLEVLRIPGPRPPDEAVAQ